MAQEAYREAVPYGTEWFQKRAFSTLRPLGGGGGAWDYSDSLLIYLPGADEEYEAIQDDESDYNRLVTVPERSYLESVASDIVRGLPQDFDYIDLGPGTAHKEQLLFDAAREQGKNFVYRPVDISEKYLRMSGTYATAQGIPTQPLRAAFEEVAQKLGAEERPRFVSLGLTYSNYEPEHILAILKGITGAQGSAFINAHLRERTDMKTLREIYADVIPGLVAEKMKLLGIEKDDIESHETTDEIKVWAKLRSVSPVLETRGIASGDRLLVLQSLRPSLKSFHTSLESSFANVRLLDTGAPFVGARIYS